MLASAKACSETGGCTPTDPVAKSVRPPVAAPSGKPRHHQRSPALQANMEVRSAHEVFVSYSHEDLDAVRRIVDDLEAGGLRVFWDQNLLPGQRWSEVIESALNASKAVLVVWSLASVKSTWVRAEASAAMDRGMLVPVRIDDAAIPLPFGQVQSADLSASTSSAYEVSLDSVMSALRSIGGSHRGPAVENSARPSPRMWRRPRRLDFAYWFLALGGRMDRGDYWLAQLVFFSVTQLLPLLGPTRVRSWEELQSAQLIFAVTMIVSLYPEFALVSKRLHDFDWSAWWALLVILMAVWDGMLDALVLIPRGVHVVDAHSGLDVATVKPFAWAVGLAHFALLLAVGVPRGSRTSNRFGPAS